MIPDEQLRAWTREGKPRVCGDDPAAAGQGDLDPRVNPACAGMIRRWCAWPARQRRKPRVCGDDPSVLDANQAKKK